MNKTNRRLLAIDCVLLSILICVCYLVYVEVLIDDVDDGCVARCDNYRLNDINAWYIQTCVDRSKIEGFGRNETEYYKNCVAKRATFNYTDCVEGCSVTPLLTSILDNIRRR